LSKLRFGLARLDFVFILILFWSFNKGGNAALAWAFSAGLFMDLVSGGPLGPFTISLPAVAFIASFIYEHVSPSNPFISFPIALLLFILYDLLKVAILSFIGYNFIKAESIALITLPSALLNAVVAVPACLLLSRLYKQGEV